MAKFIVWLLAAVGAVLLFQQSAHGFTTGSAAAPPKSTAASISPTALHVLGPKQYLQMEKMKNPEKTEATIKGLMKKNKLTREQAEKRYGEFLADPDGFALRAGEARNRAEGYRNWEEAAIGRSDDPEATRARIEKFKADNQKKALGIIGLLCSFLLYTSSTNQVVNFNGFEDNPRTNPAYQYMQTIRAEEAAKEAAKAAK